MDFFCGKTVFGIRPSAQCYFVLFYNLFFGVISNLYKIIVILNLSRIVQL